MIIDYQLCRFNKYINLGDLIALLGSIDSVSGSIDLSSIISSGFRYLASSIPLICLAGVAIGAGSIPSISIFALLY